MGIVDGLGMFSGMTTYCMTLLKGNVGLVWERKGWSYCTIMMEGRDYGQLKDLISDSSRWRQDSKRECM